MKCSNPPFSATSGVQSMIVSGRGSDLAVDVGDDDPGRAHIGDVAFLQEDDPVRVGQDRRHVAGDEGLLAVEPHEERHVLTGADQPAGLIAVHDHDRIGADHSAQGRPNGVGQVAVVGLFDEVGKGLGIGLGGERVAPSLEAVAKLTEVLDDAVVDDGDLAATVHVGMGIEVVRPAVRRPARVGQAHRGVGRPVDEGRGEVRELAGPLLDEQVTFLIDEGDTGRVVAAVFEATESLEENRAGLAGPRVADDAAHRIRFLFWSLRPRRAFPGSMGWAPRSV